MIFYRVLSKYAVLFTVKLSLGSRQFQSFLSVFDNLQINDSKQKTYKNTLRKKNLLCNLHLLSQTAHTPGHHK